MALIAATIANKGNMMKPILVSKVQSSDNIIIKTQNPTVLTQVLSPNISDMVTDMMVEVVNEGTGKNAKIKGVRVAGKTGTAENELSGKDEHGIMPGL